MRQIVTSYGRNKNLDKIKNQETANESSSYRCVDIKKDRKGRQKRKRKKTKEQRNERENRQKRPMKEKTN